jgi:hypothetical protein
MDNKIDNNIPVVFIHFGDIPNYLIDAITQAVSFSNKVYLVTDNKSTVCQAEIIDSSQINSDEVIFKSYYKHMSSNSYQFEYMCIYRWFVLKNFMNSKHIEMLLYLDSDVFLYSQTSTIMANYNHFEFAYCVPDNQENYYWAGSACCSIWSKSSINLFCDTIASYYTSDKIEILNEKWKYHTDNVILGGICDMTFLYFFSKKSGFFNLGKVHNNHSFDFNNASSTNLINNEYRFNQSNLFQIPTKDITFKNGIPYGFHLLSKKSVCFFALTEYAKLLMFSKKHSVLIRLRHTFYTFKKLLIKKYTQIG